MYDERIPKSIINFIPAVSDFQQEKLQGHSSGMISSGGCCSTRYETLYCSCSFEALACFELICGYLTGLLSLVSFYSFTCSITMLAVLDISDYF